MVVADIKASEASGQYYLEVKEPNPFTGGYSDTSRTVMLNSRKDKQIDMEIVERTQEDLRKYLNDPTIEFTDPQQMTNNPNHIVNWVQAHKGAPISLITENNGFFNLGEGHASDSIVGDSNFLQTFGQNEMTYDPTKHRVSFFNSLTEKEQQAVRSLDTHAYGDVLNTNPSGTYIGLRSEGIITDVIITNANKMQQTVTRLSIDQLKADLINYLQIGNIDANFQIAQNIQNLSPSAGLTDILYQVGGMNAELVQGTAQSGVAGLLDSTDRLTVAFYVQNPQTGYVYQMTAFKAARTIAQLNNESNVQFEFLTEGFKSSDFIRFINRIAGLRTTRYSIDDIFQVCVQNNIFNQQTSTFNIQNSAELLKALRTLFVGHKIELSSTLKSRSGVNDLDKLGTYLQSIHETANVNEIRTEPFLVAQNQGLTQQPQQNVVDINQNQSNANQGFNQQNTFNQGFNQSPQAVGQAPTQTQDFNQNNGFNQNQGFNQSQGFNQAPQQNVATPADFNSGFNQSPMEQQLTQGRPAPQEAAINANMHADYNKDFKEQHESQSHPAYQSTFTPPFQNNAINVTDDDLPF